MREIIFPGSVFYCGKHILLSHCQRWISNPAHVLSICQASVFFCVCESQTSQLLGTNPLAAQVPPPPPSSSFWFWKCFSCSHNCSYAFQRMCFSKHFLGFYRRWIYRVIILPYCHNLLMHVKWVVVCGWSIRTICKRHQSKQVGESGKHRSGLLSFDFSRQMLSNLVTTSSL